MKNALSLSFTVAVELFAITSMLAVGLRYSVGEIFAPLRNVRGSLAVLAANFVFVPLLAFLVARLIQLDAAYASGLMIVGCAAGAAFSVKLLVMAKNDAAFGSGLLVVLIVGTIGYLPLVLPRLVPGGAIGAWNVARPLVLTMLVPLAAGMAFRAWSPRRAASAIGWLARIASLSMIVLIVLSIGLNVAAVGQLFGTGAIIAAILFTIASYAAGYVVGAFGGSLRDDVGLITAQRNFAAALVVATESFPDRRVLVMVVVMSLLSFIVLIPLAKLLGKRHQPSTRPTTSAPTDHGHKAAA